MVLKEVFLTGGSGTLGSELIKNSELFGVNFVAPSSTKCNIVDEMSVYENLSIFTGDVVVHAAAATDVKGIENSPIDAMRINVQGTINMIENCFRFNKKLIHISTDYVFDGEKGDYLTSDLVNPVSKYAKTKTAAEFLVRTIEEFLIIRTSFFGYEFPYDKAAADQWSTKDYVDVIAPLIMEHLFTDERGIIHVGTQKTTTYEKALRRKSNVEKVYLKDIPFKIPRDISLITEAE